MKYTFAFILAILVVTPSKAQYDVCIYGGTSAGVIAAYTAAMQHKKVILLEPGKHLGGLSSGGLGYTDIGNKYAVTGLGRDFYRRTGNHYGKFESWIFEPHVAEKIFADYIKAANVPVLYGYRIIGATKQQTTIQAITVENATAPAAATNKTINARVFIDCSYEGDLMAKAGVSYTIGREDNAVYNETWNGIQLLDKHQFPDSIDPYKIKGDPSSGLLWGISNNKVLPDGTGNKMVQTYNYRICLTNNPANRIDITPPQDYDASMYELLLRVQEKRPSKNLNDAVLKIDLMPDYKTDINNNGPFSTDMIGMNHAYPDADYSTRQKILQAHVQYIKGLLYFIGHDPRMPRHLRTEMLQWGYPKDEFQDNGHFTPQAYVRESRRMTGAYVMTQANCEGREIVDDGVGMAAYTMDSHNCQRLVVNGMVKNEGDVQKGGFGPYPVSYRALVPKAGECTNLYVPVCLSASHIAYGSIRMEPVFMVLAQSCAAAACMAIDNNQTVQAVNIKELQKQLIQNPLMDGSTPEILVDDSDSLHVKTTGNWSRQARGGYGPSWLQCNTGATNRQIVFTPQVHVAGAYALYTYVAHVEGASAQTQYNIFDGTTTRQVFITANNMVEGQASGEWVSLGTYTLPKGNRASVAISTAKANGIVTADAVLFVPVR